MVRGRAHSAPEDNFQIVQPDGQDFSVFAGSGTIVIGNEAVLPCRVDLHPGRTSRGETTSTDPTIRRTLEFRQSRLSMRQGGIPVPSVRGDRKAVWFVAFGPAWIEGDARQERSGLRIEPQDFVGHRDRHVHRGVPEFPALACVISTATGGNDTDDEQARCATNQNCGVSFHRPVFMSDT